MRKTAVLLFLLLYPGAALAQLDAPPEPTLPPPPPTATPAEAAPDFKTRITSYRPSPQFTQDRSFTSTRFWRLDPGSYEAEVWLRTRYFKEPMTPSEFLLQAEIEIGLTPHLQIDIYENLTFNVDDSGNRGVQQEGNQIEARISIPRYYGQMFGNPVIYLEWHPRHNQPDRAEVRLLLGGALAKWVYLAVNPYVETNVQPTDITTAALDNLGQPMVIHTSRFLADMEFGTTVAAGFRITDWLRLSAELKIGADMLGDADNHLHFVWYLGPGFILKPLRNNYLKIMGTCLFAIPPTPIEKAPTYGPSQMIEPLFIIGSQF